MGSVTGLPPELIAGWALWAVGGIALTIWFIRRSAAARQKEAPRADVRLQGAGSGTHAVAPRVASGTQKVARSISGTHAAARTVSGTVPAAGRQPSGTHSAAGRPGIPPAAPPGNSSPYQAASARVSGTHAAARPSGTYTAARPPLSGTHPAASPHGEPIDPFEELRRLLDPPEDSSGKE